MYPTNTEQLCPEQQEKDIRDEQRDTFGSFATASISQNSPPQSSAVDPIE